LPRVFISYSHDSPEFQQLVRGLADRLRDNGIDAWLDLYTPAPLEGWPRWMETEISKANFVLLVCTENYHQRVSMNAAPGKGLGALWESHLIFQLLYEAGTVNPKFIPVLPVDGNIAYIPTSLRGVQRYNPFSEEGFWDLYRRLTEQPAVQVPKLGKQIVMPPVEPTIRPPQAMKQTITPVRCVNSRLALVATEEGAVYVPVAEAKWDESEATLLFAPDEHADGSFLDNLRNRQSKVRLAYKGNAAICSVQTVQQRSKDGVDQWQIVFRLQEADFANSMEYEVNGLTPDQGAVIRAQRLLLNEHLPLSDRRRGFQDMEELVIRGQQAEMPIERSPFPGLFGEFGSRPELFIEAAWITAMLQLKMSATVEQVGRFELTLDGNSLHVEFAGRRHKQYSNQPAFEIKVSGKCSLRTG